MGWLKDFIGGVVGVFNPVSFIINLAVSWAIGEVAKDKQEQAIAEAEARHAGTLLNTRSNVANLPVIYGQRKVGGTIVFTATSGSDNTYLYIVLALCEGEVEEIGDIYLNDTISTDSRFSGLVTINKHLGSDTQTADSMLTGANIGWTSAHIGKGVAYLACRFKWDQNAFSGMPTIHAMIKGHKVYDTRSSGTDYSTNPALFLRDYLTNTRYGKGLASSVIDDTLISAAANQCDTLVTPYSGATQQKLFECNTVLHTGRTLMSNVKVLLSGMRGIMPYQQGIYSLVIEDELQSGVTPFAFDESNIVGGINIQSEKKSTKFNKCIATFVNPSANWQRDQVQWPPAGSTEENNYQSADGEELIQRIELETITNPYTAEDIAEIVVKRSREGKLVQFKATSEALQVTVPDIITVTHSTPAWSAKPFRVLNVQMPPDGTVTIEAVEHQDSIYPWSSKTEKDNIPDTNLPDPFNISPPTGLAISEELYQTSGSKGLLTRALISWTASSNMFVSGYEVHYKLTSASVWQSVTITSTTAAQIDDINPADYDFRIRSLNAPVQSLWSATVSKSILGLTARPANIQEFFVLAKDGQAHIRWQKSTDLDVINGGFIRIRHSNKTTGASWLDGADLGGAIPGNASTAVLPLITGTYMAKAVDSGGRFSEQAVLAMTSVPSILEFNAVATATEHTTFNGTKTGMIALNNNLQLDGDPIQLVTEAGDSLTTEAGDQLITEVGDLDNLQSSGTYDFANIIDLGAVYTSRVTSSIGAASDPIVLVTEAGDTLTTEAGDQFVLGFAGEASEFVNTEIQISTTDDDPNGSPTWTDWQPFFIGDYHARGYQFRAVVTSASGYQIYIDELSVQVDMPDRTERAVGVAIPAAGLNISFAQAFYAEPAVGITLQDATTGDYFTITSAANNGFTLRCFNASNIGIAKTANWIATGYGRAA